MNEQLHQLIQHVSKQNNPGAWLGSTGGFLDDAAAQGKVQTEPAPEVVLVHNELLECCRDGNPELSLRIFSEAFVGDMLYSTSGSTAATLMGGTPWDATIEAWLSCLSPMPWAQWTWRWQLGAWLRKLREAGDERPLNLAEAAEIMRSRGVWPAVQEVCSDTMLRAWWARQVLPESAYLPHMLCLSHAWDRARPAFIPAPAIAQAVNPRVLPGTNFDEYFPK